MHIKTEFTGSRRYQETRQSDVRPPLGDISNHPTNHPNLIQEASKKPEKKGSSKLEKKMAQQREKYEQRLREIAEARKEGDEKVVPIASDEQSVPIGDGITYEKKTKNYLIALTGTHITEITITFKKGDVVLGEPTTSKYIGDASSIARQCNAKIDAFIQNNYHDVVAKNKQQIEAEMAPRYAALGATPDPKRTEKFAELGTERTKRIAQIEQAKQQIKAEMALKYAALSATPDTELNKKFAELGTERAEKIAQIEQAKQQIEAEMAPKYAALGPTPDTELNKKFAELDTVLTEKFAQIEQAKQQIEAEMAPKYAALGPTPDTELNKKFAELDTELTEKFAEVEKKAGEELRKYLDNRSGKFMDTGLLDELQWMQGLEYSDRERKRKKDSAEKKRHKNPEALQRNVEEIKAKIKKMKEIISLSNSARSASDLPQAPETNSENRAQPASDLSQPPLTWENFETKIDAYMKTPTKGLSDPIFNEITSLLADDSRYPKSLGADDKKKLHQTLLDIQHALADRHDKVNEPLEQLEKQRRYNIGHYGKRLKYERQLKDHMGIVAQKEGEYAEAVHKELVVTKETDEFFKAAARSAKKTPTLEALKAANDAAIRAGDTNAVKAAEEIKAIMLTLTEENINEEKMRRIVSLRKQIPNGDDILKELHSSVSLEVSLEKLNQARLVTAEAKARLEETKANKAQLEKGVEQAKVRDDADDALDDKKVYTIKEADKASLQHERTLEQKRVDHFNARNLEDHKMRNKEEEEIRQFLRNLDKTEVGNEVMQERLKTMYLLALFGSGDQAALFALGRDSSSEFNSYMSLFR
jgi:hypothetical protein